MTFDLGCHGKHIFWWILYPHYNTTWIFMWLQVSSFGQRTILIQFELRPLCFDLFTSGGLRGTVYHPEYLPSKFEENQFSPLEGVLDINYRLKIYMFPSITRTLTYAAMQQYILVALGIFIICEKFHVSGIFSLENTIKKYHFHKLWPLTAGLWHSLPMSRMAQGFPLGYLLTKFEENRLSC